MDTVYSMFGLRRGTAQRSIRAKFIFLTVNACLVFCLYMHMKAPGHVDQLKFKTSTEDKKGLGVVKQINRRPLEEGMGVVAFEEEQPQAEVLAKGGPENENFIGDVIDDRHESVGKHEENSQADSSAIAKDDSVKDSIENLVDDKYVHEGKGEHDSNDNNTNQDLPDDTIENKSDQHVNAVNSEYDSIDNTSSNNNNHDVHEDTNEMKNDQQVNDKDNVAIGDTNTVMLQQDAHQDNEAPSVYRKQFLQWDDFDTVKLEDRNAREGDVGYLIYTCTEGGLCGGWADQIKGAVITYIVANLTKRTFKAEFLKMQKCNLSNYIMPNRVNWSLPYFQHKDILNESNHIVHPYLGSRYFKPLISFRNFSRMFRPQYRYQFWRTNLDYLSYITNHSLYQNELSWMRGLTPADMYSLVYKRLFKLSPRLQSRLQSILSENLPTPKHRLVCIHIRMGHNGFHHDWQVRNHIENLPKIWSNMGRLLQTEYDRLFVMSDSTEVLESAQIQPFKDRLFTVPGEIVHIDKFKKSNDTIQSACNGFERVLLEYHLLMSCDVLVRGHSGISVLASAVRGTDKDLFCLHMDGNIAPCQRNNFTTFP